MNTCSVCGREFTEDEWEDRHTDSEGEDCHSYCCPTCELDERLENAIDMIARLHNQALAKVRK